MTSVSQPIPAERNAPISSANAPLISVVVVNYNCLKWLDRFFPSIREQTIFDRVEIILVDNSSTDGSDAICREKMKEWDNGVFLPTGGNYGFGGGCNRGTAIARGKYLLFINPDVWLETDCLEKLWEATEQEKISVGCPLVLDYDSNNIQIIGGIGFDIFGNVIAVPKTSEIRRVFSVGTFFFINRDIFSEVGGFDEEFFLYNEETDLSWRAWIAGNPVVSIYSARIHHQGASVGDRNVENKTSEMRRFYANRNQFLTILKDARGPLLLLFFTQLLLLTGEAVVGALASRRLGFIRWSLLKPLAECWRLRRHVMEQRKRIRAYRKVGDFWIASHFCRFGFGRAGDLQRLLKFGIKIDPARSNK